MSVQFGECNFDGKPVDPKDLEQVRPVLAPYGPDGEGYICKDNVGIIYRAFHTTKESRQAKQPYVSPSGAVITWDGRLDNREELIHEFNGEVSSDSTDLAIAAAAYQRWDTNSFAKLVGDWAIAIWEPTTKSLLLAKDVVGTRHLYYSVEPERVTWCTILDPLVLFAGRPLALEEQYIAGWLSQFPAAHLTPYVGIHCVPPASFVLLTPKGPSVRKYWDFDPGKRIRYRTDREYEEHFRHVFSESVRRRLRSNSPILAELSGGMDSSSIVCRADQILAGRGDEAPRLDTVSYYDDCEPNWNEKPFFSKVEERRGRAGCHINVGAETFRFEFDRGSFAATPGSGGRPFRPAQQFAECMLSQGNRVVLSGIGGDEVTGGVPTPVPELMDALATLRLKTLARQLKLWALNKRKPWLYLLLEAVRGFFPSALVGPPKEMQPAPWLQAEFVKRNRAALRGYPSTVKFFGPLPSFQDNLSTLETLRRQMACSLLPACPVYEKRYPYLDQDLLEFLYAIPREQLVRPGQRRSLMRRALAGIVPDEILQRKRKAFVVRGPMTSIAGAWAELVGTSVQARSACLGIVDQKAFCEAVCSARQGREIHMVAMLRMLGVESWLRAITDQGVLLEGPLTESGSLGVHGEEGAPGTALPKKASAS